ncbi:Uncharacterized protein SCF082_LOCUS28764 [Durusdinium trenchii]|uniref:Uncharacterized protein n=1 Tax=Durusdinium trenchii TaxID=1381693 RepID=A0ABP0MRC5_9DINO
MDADMDELMDLLAYECPYTGKKRIPGCYESVDQQSSTKKIKIGSTPDNYDKVDLQTSPDGYDETMFSEYFNRGLSGEPCEPPPAHVNCANCPEHLQRTINAACCKHVVQIAKHEVDNNPASSQAMREFACIREEDAEVGVRKMVGVSSLSKMKGVLTEFWRRYKTMDAGHPVFELERNGVLSLDRLVPFYSHSDEGRSFRDAALWVLNIHGVIGRGTLAYLREGHHRDPVSQNPQGLNYIGNTWSTHFLIATMSKSVATPEALSNLVSSFALDVKALLHDGLQHDQERIWFIHLGSKGDLPALAKLARFTRTFAHTPRAASSRKACQGVCWRCLAGQERDDRNHLRAIPFEDVSKQPVWEATIGQVLPWQQTPPILEGLGLDDRRATDFFQSDFFHNVHLGVLKSFTSSALVSLVEANPPLPCFQNLSSVDKKFEHLSSLYKNFFQARGKKPWVTELSRDLVCWPMSSTCPAAKWNKGMATVEIMRFIDWFAQNFLAAAAKAINIAVTFMYKSGLWLQSTSARRLSDWIFSFLGHYSLLAQLTLNAGKARYPMYPKNHMLCHAAVDLARRAERCEWQLSPLSTACQQEEDFIGKPSKISRFTNIRQAHRSVIWRSMIKIQYSLQQAGNDQRGMDSYADL